MYLKTRDIQMASIETMWFEEREKFLKKLFPAARFKVDMSPEQLDSVISTEERIRLIIDNCCDSPDEKHGSLIPNNMIAISVYKRDKPAITIYDCIKAIEAVGWEPKCEHCVLTGTQRLVNSANERLMCLYTVVWEVDDL